MDTMQILQERGFVKQVTHPELLEERLNEKPIVFYLGIDPTADSLHVGHLLPLMAASCLQQAGHIPIVVIGGGTALIGDPSGKTELRQMLTPEQIKANVIKLEVQLAKFIHFDNGKGYLVNNASWLAPLNYIDFLREIGSLFSVNRMLAADSVKIRLEKGLSFVEFNYQILQAYDYLKLSNIYGCQLQIGGNDQWGNIVAGIDLIHRKTGNYAYGLTMPLLTNSAGEKMGKTATGAVWLNPDKLSPFGYYQYWLNVSDDDVINLLKLYTFIPLDEIKELAKLRGQGIREAKRRLAYEATLLAHGKDAADSAHQDLPQHIVTSSMMLVTLLVEVGFAKTNSAARRLIEGSGVRLNHEKVIEDLVIDPKDIPATGLILKAGKKHAVLLLPN